MKIYNILLLITLNLVYTSIIWAKNINAELLHHSTKIQIKNSILIKEIQTKIKIINRNGEVYANISIPYSKLVKIYDLKAHITDVDGNVVKSLDKDDIKDKRAKSFFKVLLIL
jgi:ribosomal protein L36